jgi:hypothetical protein
MKILKSFKLFENSEDVNVITSTVRDMLLELSFLDITTSCNYLAGRFITINLSKPSQKTEDGWEVSFNWSDVSEVMDSVFSYLESEGYHWVKNGIYPYQQFNKNGGTKSLSNFEPNILIFNASAQVSKSVCEIWFEI